MATGGRQLTITLIFGLMLGAAAPALAVEVPHGPPSLPVPTVPNLPPPPVGTGQCIAVVQGQLDGASAEGGRARDLFFVAFNHQNTEGSALFAALSLALTPDEEDVVATFAGLGEASTILFFNASKLPLLLGEGAGKALEDAVNGTGMVAIALVPIGPAQLTNLTLWANDRFNATFNPIMAFNNQTGMGHLMAEPTLPITWGIEYLRGQAEDDDVPMQPTNEGLENSSEGMDLALSGLGTLAWAGNDAGDIMVRALLQSSQIGAPLAEGAGDQMGRGTDSLAERGGTMARFAGDDANAAAGLAQDAAGRSAQRAGTVPGALPGCPTLRS